MLEYEKLGGAAGKSKQSLKFSKKKYNNVS